ncbi:MAG: DinB family protein [Micropruina sp.]|nr:MAG: DinB family protein [Micropruina sp.]
MTDDQGRPEPPETGDEQETLLGFLEFHRATLAWKTSGLTDEQLRERVAPSSMTLGGLLKHLALVEDYWFGEVVAQQPASPPFADVDWEADPDWEWHSATDDTGEALRSLWRARVERSRARLAQALADEPAGLSATRPRGKGQQLSLRWVVTHLIEEYARHNGHADLIRESVDGHTGE